MLRPENILDNLVKTVKATEAFSQVRFIHAGKTANAEKPVESCFVACGVGVVHKEKDILGNRKFTAQLEFQIYVPYTQGARELSALAVSLMDTLDRYDTEGEISEVKISDPVYDDNLCTLTQKVSAQLMWEIVPEETQELPESSTVSIVLNGIQVQVLSFVAQMQDDVYVLRELLAGDTDRCVSRGRKYTLTVTAECACDPFEGLEDINITLSSGSVVRTFENCIVTKVTEQKSPKEVPFREYVLLAVNTKTTERSTA